MQKPDPLADFTIKRLGEDFRIQIELESGAKFDFSLTDEQLDTVADQIEDALESEDEPEEDKPEEE